MKVFKNIIATLLLIVGIAGDLACTLFNDTAFVQTLNIKSEAKENLFFIILFSLLIVGGIILYFVGNRPGLQEILDAMPADEEEDNEIPVTVGDETVVDPAPESYVEETEESEAEPETVGGVAHSVASDVKEGIRTIGNDIKGTVNNVKTTIEKRKDRDPGEKTIDKAILIGAVIAAVGTTATVAHLVNKRKENRRGIAIGNLLRKL